MMLAKPLGNHPLYRLLGAVYWSVVRIRNWLYDVRILSIKSSPLPVISVGGIHAGGTGKTPLSGLIAEHFIKQGQTVALVSRGYRRLSRQQITVSPAQSARWEEVGDEPALLRNRHSSLWLGIGADRASSLSALQGCMPHTQSIALLDDGFQHRRCARSLDILCLPPDPFSDYAIPAGTMREPLSSCKRAACMCLIGNQSQLELLGRSQEKLRRRWPHKPIFILLQSPGEWIQLQSGRREKTLQGVNRAGLVCGIARPERFATLVTHLGITTVATKLFEDHHHYSSAELEAFGRSGIDAIVTTEKDAVKLKGLNLVNCPDIWYLTITLHIHGPRAEHEHFSAFLQRLTEKKEGWR